MILSENSFIEFGMRAKKSTTKWNPEGGLIDEAECILERLTQQLTQKDYWNETIFFVSKDENLNKALIKYLENRLHTMIVTIQLITY